jgi:hypothetical protein
MLAGHVEGAQYEAATKLDDLKASLSSLSSKGSSELFRYFPVAVIAVLETHFKATVQAIVDSGSPYLDRGLALTRDRLRSASELLPILHRKTVTVGELVAHQLPFNSVASIEDALGTLFDAKLKGLVGTARDPYHVRNEIDSLPLVDDVEALWRDLAKTFERRHILAHEAASNYVVTFDHAESAIDCAVRFTAAVDALLWATVWKHLPLTQYEMNTDAWSRYGEVRKKFARTLWHAWAIAKKNNQQKAFYNLHRNWRAYARGWSRFEVDEFGMGSIRPLIAATAHERLLKARAKDVMDWVAWEQPEEPDRNVIFEPED